MFENIPIAEVNRDNINDVWPFLLTSIQKAELIAIDLELSGLGTRVGNKQFFPNRYKEIREAAQTRTILSIGIAVFYRKELFSCAHNQHTYKCKVFDILILENKPFVVEPDALTFLSSHGFDFNRLLSHGISYSKTRTMKNNTFQALWEEILASGVSIALHNGLVDLAFIHEHFYAPLPEDPNKFVANIADWFGERSENAYQAIECTLWDSKFMAAQHPKFTSTYLEYVFRKIQRENYRRIISNKEPYLDIKFALYRKIIRKKISFNRTNCSLTDTFLGGRFTNVSREQLCETYWEHDIDLILDYEDNKAQIKKEKEKRKREKRIALQQNGIKNSETIENGENIDRKRYNNNQNNHIDQKKKKVGSDNQIIQKNTEPTNNVEGSIAVGAFAVRGHHRAGIDAFMTGFSVLYFNIDYANSHNGAFDKSSSRRISLPGKDIPLLIQKSQYASPSEGHELNWQRIESRRRGFDAIKFQKIRQE